MTRNTQTSMYDTIMEIASMMIEDGYTAAEVTAVAAELQNTKSSFWDLEKATGKDLGTKMIGGNAWVLDKVAIYMEAYFGDTSRDFWADTYEDAAIVSRKCAEIIDPIYYNDDDCSTYYNTDRPYYNDDDLLAFLGEFAEEYDIEAIRSDVTYYDYQAGRRYWDPKYTDDTDALMRICDLHHMEEFEECPNPALQAEIDEAKREEDDEYHTAPAAEPDLDFIRREMPDFAYCGTDAPEVESIQEKLRATDDHADVDDSWMDRRCYTTIRAKDAASGQRVDVDPPTWRDKLEMEHQLREDGYEFVDVTTDGGRLVILWYRPMMPRPVVDSLIDEVKGC